MANYNENIMTIISNTNVGELMTITIDDVPQWLHDSDFFENLSENSRSDEFQVGSQYIRGTSDIQNITDFICVIRVISYWSVKQIPLSVKESFDNNIISCDQFYIVQYEFSSIGETYWNIMGIFARKFVDDVSDFEIAVQAISHFDLQDEVPRFIYEFVINKYYDTERFSQILQEPNYKNLGRFWDKMKIINSNSISDAILILCEFDYDDLFDFLCSIASDFNIRSVYREAHEKCVQLGRQRNAEILNMNGITIGFENARLW